MNSVVRAIVGGTCLMGAAVAGAACSSNAPSDASPSLTEGAIAGDFVGMHRRIVDEDPVNQPIKAACTLNYYGGPVIPNVKVVEVNWTSNVDPNVQSTMPKFYADIVQSAYFDWLGEYGTVGLNGAADGKAGSNQGLSRGSFLESVTIAPGTCAGTTNCTVSDAAVAAEIIAQINAGSLPEPTLGCDGQADTLYMIDFPANVTITQGGTSSCANNGFCGYHRTTTWTSSTGQKIIVPYAVLPDMTTKSNCHTGCGNDSNYLNNSTAVHSHELVEAVTDPDVGLTNQVARPVAWINGNLGCGEIGDICNGLQTKVVVGANTWVVQKQWSNKQQACVGTPFPTAAAAVCTGAGTPAGCHACTCADLGNACTASCSGAGTTATCGGSCTPTTCAAKGATCGSLPDGCGKTLDCGPCTTGTTCGTNNTCTTTCVPSTCASLKFDCGSASDGCGGTLGCGTCGSGETCTANVCTCAPTTCAAKGATCGSLADGCGKTLDCGACASDETCTANACVKTCVPATCASAGAGCGSLADGCGGTVACGDCASTDTCVANQCVATAVDSGAPAEDSGAASDDSAIAPDDTGTTAGTDSGTPTEADSAVTDAGKKTGAPSGTSGGDSGGCGCRTPQGGREESKGAWLAAVVGLGLIVTRRRRAR